MHFSWGIITIFQSVLLILMICLELGIIDGK